MWWKVLDLYITLFLLKKFNILQVLIVYVWIDNGIITPYYLGKAVLQNTEIRRLNNVLADCLLFFNVQTEEEFLKEVDSISDDIIFELEDCLLSRWIQKEDEEQFSNEEFDEDVGADNLYEDGENFEDYETYDNHY